MQTAEERVLDSLVQLSENQAVTTAELAKNLGLSRSVVSHYLNNLIKKGKIEKISGRPVRWQLNKQEKNTKLDPVFKDFIGYRGSMRQVINQVKAAVVYPPNGLNILITGHSGVGKSYLAEKIADYARESGAVKRDAPYIVLNCADYANNPELVSSMLFGYVKGAYTGADENQDGLLKEANGGYLFLDEVHRLSSENQEKLFSFIDSGVFYPMGDNVHPVKANVRLILATTEDPDQVLLTTFLRRIPVHISLPNYVKRPIDERLTLLRYLFYQEAKKISKKIEVDKYVVSALLQVQHSGNIGYLKNIIQVSCAAAYQEQIGTDTIRLKMSNVLLNSLPPFEDFGSIKLDPTKPFQRISKSITQQGIANLHTSLKKLNDVFNNQTIDECKVTVQRFSKLISEWTLKSGLHLQHQRLFKKIIEKRFGLKETNYLEPLFFLFYENHFVIDKSFRSHLLQRIKKEFPRSIHVAQTFYKELSILNDESQESLVIILTLLLSDHIDENIQLRGLMVAHGENTATSIQSVVNSLCGTYIFDAIDMPIETGVNSIIEEANKLIDSFNTNRGFILMVDMGSLGQLYSEISSHLDGDLLVINNLTTLTALDIALKMQQNAPFKEISQKAENDYMIGVQYYEGFSQSPNILVSCISGMGIAEKISDIIQPLLTDDIKVIPVDYASLKQKINEQDWKYFDRTLFVLTTIDLPNDVQFEHINLYELLDQNGEQNLRNWLSPYMSLDQVDYFIKQLIRFFSKEGISERLSFLNPDVVIKQVETINNKYENYYHLNLDGKVKLNLYMHIALMIERLMVQKTVGIEVKPQTPQEKEFFKITKSIFQPIELKYNIKISSYEISLLYELFKQFISV